VFAHDGRILSSSVLVAPPDHIVEETLARPSVEARGLFGNGLCEVGGRQQVVAQRLLTYNRSAHKIHSLCARDASGNEETMALGL